MWAKYKPLVYLVGAIATAILFFTPMTYSKETRQMVEGIKDELRLEELNDVKWFYKKNCTNLKTQEWLCAPEELEEYEEILRKIKILEEKLGIGG